MNLNTCIQQSYSERYQNLAKQDFENNSKNFFSRRIKGVVMLPFAAIADAFKCIFYALCELKSAVTDRANYRDHLTFSANYVALAAFFLGKACVAPVVNAINPKIYSAVQDALNEQHTTALAGKDTVHAAALAAKDTTLTDTLAVKDREITQIRSEHFKTVTKVNDELQKRLQETFKTELTQKMREASNMKPGSKISAFTGFEMENTRNDRVVLGRITK